MEKAGKSTLINALIKSDLLPNDSVRCTYTTTEIRAGKQDEATVYFYTSKDFNEKFKKLMQDLKYPEEVNFQTMDLSTFNHYWDNIKNNEKEKALFQLHDNSTVQDIREMLKGKEIICRLLDTGQRTLSEAEKSELRLYITGKQESNGDIEPRQQPYAVKNVLIRSTKLESMSNIVLYDVPGFNSPTELHKTQTEQMLKEADAIILVTNVGDTPNLTGTHLDMLKKVEDYDNIRLNEKTFLFGNKIDQAADEDSAKRNIETLRNDAVKKYGIVSADHIVCGSALLSLESSRTDVRKKLVAWQMEDGIDDLKDKMQHYYNTDRFEVLKRRAEKILNNTREFLDNVLKSYPADALDRSDDERSMLVLNTKNKVTEFTTKASTISSKYQKQIIEERPFRKALIDHIDTIYPLHDVFLPMIQETENSITIDTTGNYQADKIDTLIRDKLQIIFMKNIVTQASSITDQKQKEIRSELVQTFLQIMGMSPHSNYRKELEDSVNELFDKMLIENGAKCYFNPLIERFITGLVESLILYPFATDTRFNKIKDILPELFSLSVYYTLTEKNDDINNISDSAEHLVDFFAKILLHTNNNLKDLSEYDNIWQEFFNNHKQQFLDGTQFVIDMLPFGKWTKLLVKSGIQLHNNLPKNLTIAIKEIIYDNKWKQMDQQQRENAIGQTIKSFCQNNMSDVSLLDQLNALHEESKKIKTMETQDDIIVFLDEDIEILRDITVKAVVKAIGLETAFISIITKNINLIRDELKDNVQENNLFNTWITKNIDKLKEEEISNIKANKRYNQTRQEIRQAIQDVFDELSAV